ncbi:MAG: SIS domain-containing protein [Chloroflexi bacterium]|nr:SIS domain-containing protein [Chloroflexota bacterium]
MSKFEQDVGRILDEQKRVLSGVSDDSIQHLKHLILKADRIFVTGKGRSGLQVKGFAMRLMHLGMQVHVIDDVTTPAIGEADLLIIMSGSGKTPSLKTYAEGAAQFKAKIVLLTAADDSPIHCYADLVLKLDATTSKLHSPSISSLPMGSLFETSMGLIFEVIAIQLMDELNISSSQMMSRHANLE